MDTLASGTTAPPCTQASAAMWQVATIIMGTLRFVQESRLLTSYLSAFDTLRTFLRNADGWPYPASVGQLRGFASRCSTSRQNVLSVTVQLAQLCCRFPGVDTARCRCWPPGHLAVMPQSGGNTQSTLYSQDFGDRRLQGHNHASNMAIEQTCWCVLFGIHHSLMRARCNTQQTSSYTTNLPHANIQQGLHAGVWGHDITPAG